MVRIAVFGAGAIGCWVGGRLAAGGADVVLIARPRVADEIAGGLKLTELGGKSWAVKPEVATTPEAAASAEVVLVTVKSAATEAAGRELAAIVGARAVILSLQNGVRNADVLRAALPDRRVCAGMVPFNVARLARGHYHRGTTGTLMVEAADAVAPFTEACLRADLPLALRDDMPAVQWSKLVLNLNNAINALAGVPLATELGDREFRRCLALVQREALAALAAARVPLARVLAVPTRWIPTLLPMPNWAFRAIAARVAGTDPQARSSMFDDLAAGRATEIDYLQGEVVALAARVGRTAPANARLVELVRAAEAGGKRDFTGAELYAELAACVTRTTA